MNKLYVGFSKEMELPTTGGFLFIGDEVPDIPKAWVFDPKQHSFNPLRNLNYRKARELVDALYTISPQGENTLTVRNGKRTLLKELLRADRFDRVKGDEEVKGMVDDMLMSPVLSNVLCGPPLFPFRAGSKILARINRAELGDFDALVLGLLLMVHFKGQLVVPDLGFYGRDAHVAPIREVRLMAGVNFLEELPDKLRQAALLIEDKEASGATFEDAEVLAKYAGLKRGTTGYDDFVSSAME